METMRDRAKEHFPAVLLTMLSIIQALALEILWSRLDQNAYLWRGGFEAVVGWAQVGVVMLGILQVWLLYTSLVMRFRWLPSTRDSIFPFGIGVLEFTLVGLMGPERLALWFVAFAVIFGVSVWASWSVFRRARQDPDNREFFARYRPAGWRELVPNLAAISFLLGCALLVRLSGGIHWVTLLCLSATAALMLQQIAVNRRFWHASIAPLPSTDPAR